MICNQSLDASLPGSVHTCTNNIPTKLIQSNESLGNLVSSADFKNLSKSSGRDNKNLNLLSNNINSIYSDTADSLRPHASTTNTQYFASNHNPFKMTTLSSNTQHSETQVIPRSLSSLLESLDTDKTTETSVDNQNINFEENKNARCYAANCRSSGPQHVHFSHASMALSCDGGHCTNGAADEGDIDEGPSGSSQVF